VKKRIRIIAISFSSLLALNAYSVEKCGLYKIAGDFTCLKENCFIVSAPDTLSESFFRIENEEKLEHPKNAIPVIVTFQVDSIQNPKQANGSVLDFQVIKSDSLNVRENLPVLIQDKKCLN
jgi:hypothetical protein